MALVLLPQGSPRFAMEIVQSDIIRNQMPDFPKRQVNVCVVTERLLEAGAQIPVVLNTDRWFNISNCKSTALSLLEFLKKQQYFKMKKSVHYYWSVKVIVATSNSMSG